MAEANAAESQVPASPEQDERVKQTSKLHKALVRPELGSICGTILVFVFFLMLAGDSGMFSAEGIMNWGDRIRPICRDCRRCLPIDDLGRV